MGCACGSLSVRGLHAVLVGAWLIARGVSRPVEQLAASARRIADGDYALATNPAGMARHGRDELGQLAAAFATMARSIHEREARILHQAGMEARVTCSACGKTVLLPPPDSSSLQ